MWNVLSEVSVNGSGPVFVILNEAEKLVYTDRCFLNVVHWISTHGGGRFTLENDVQFAGLTIDDADDVAERGPFEAPELPAGVEWTLSD